VQRLFDRFRAGGLAVAGAEETLQCLANGLVDELLISAALEAARPETEPVEAILAPEIADDPRPPGHKSKTDQRRHNLYRRGAFLRWRI
jgi:peptide subunit release factor 1 (eRF1)